MSAEGRTGAVFLSYASQDAAAVRRIADALRTGGVEVWFDQNELVGGDAWDAKIRRQIAECALFVPVISANTQARLEGYFRLEWKLAAQRTHAMADERVFLLPVVIDETRDAEAKVPGEFKAVQWSRLRRAFGGQVRSSESVDDPSLDEAGVEVFCERVRALLDASSVGGASIPSIRTTSSGSESGQEAHPDPVRAGRAAAAGRGARYRWATWGGVVVGLLLAVGYFLPRRSELPARPSGPGSRASTTFLPSDEKSLVVLPLENLSPDPEQAFFTEGMHAQLIATLQRATDLRVIGRDTALAFKRGEMTVADFARRVGAVNALGGSVRRAGNKVLILLEMRRAADDLLLWTSPNTERELTDTWAVQSEVAEQIARALKARESVGSNAHARYLTKNTQAFDLFVKADQRFFAGQFRESIALYSAAFEADPGYVVPSYMLAHAYCNLCYFEPEPHERVKLAARARHWLEIVVRLDPGGFGAIAESHYASNVDEDNVRALELAERGMRALPNENAASTFHAIALEGLGRLEPALESYRRAVRIDPLLMFALQNECRALTLLRRRTEALAMVERIASLPAGSGSEAALASQRFRLEGTPPGSLHFMSPETRAGWLWRARRFAEAERAAAAGAVSDGVGEVRRFGLRVLQHDALRRMGRDAEALGLAQELLALAATLQAAPDVGPPRHAGWLAQAEARAGRVEAAIAAGLRFVADASPVRQQSMRWQREIVLAELHAYLNRPKECAELLAKLLRVPSGVTVPMLRADPAWDPVRDDPAFKALLADPKNSAPL